VTGVTIEALSPSDPRAEHALRLFMEEMATDSARSSACGSPPARAGRASVAG
jgi:hypothetical protein